MGNSLHRATTISFGNNASSWWAVSPTLGPSAFINIPSDLDSDAVINSDDLMLARQNFGSVYSLSDLFKIRNSFQATSQSSSIISKAIPVNTEIESTENERVNVLFIESDLHQLRTLGYQQTSKKLSSGTITNT